MAISRANDSKLGVSKTPPSTFDGAGYGAMVTTNVPFVGELPDISPTKTTIRFPSVTDGEQTDSGETQRAEFTLNMADDPTDAGQQMLHEAFESGDPLYFKFAYKNGRTVFCQANLLRAGTSGAADGFVLGGYQLIVKGDNVQVVS